VFCTQILVCIQNKNIRIANADFGLVYLVEGVPLTAKQFKTFGEHSDIDSTEDLLEKTYTRSMLLTKTIHKARLFDMLIGNWDHYYDNGVEYKKEVKLFGLFT
jgi:hypothetical protein